MLLWSLTVHTITGIKGYRDVSIIPIINQNMKPEKVLWLSSFTFTSLSFAAFLAANFAASRGGSAVERFGMSQFRSFESTCWTVVGSGSGRTGAKLALGTVPSGASFRADTGLAGCEDELGFSRADVKLAFGALDPMVVRIAGREHADLRAALLRSAGGDGECEGRRSRAATL